MFVLDTNTLIYFFKGLGNVAKAFLRSSPQEIGISTIVIYELNVGIAKSTFPEKRRRQLEDLLRVVQILPFDEECARQAARIRAYLEQKETPIGYYDVLIAATALANGGVLVTHNTNEFSRVPGLQLADWYKEP